MKKRTLTYILVVFVMGAWSAPAWAERVYSPLDYGAVVDGETLCTEAIQKAIDACAAAGGGVVRLPKGKIASSTIVMKSNVTLDIPEGSTLLGATRFEFYPRKFPAYRTDRIDRFISASLITWPATMSRSAALLYGPTCRKTTTASTSTVVITC